MASLVLNGNTSGSVTISSPAVSGTTTLTLPATTGTFALTAAPTFTGQATIPTINLTGGQITFPVTQSASADANTLDDYEEGTWTPSQGSGLTVVGAFSSSGTYTKIGRQITVIFKVGGATSIAVSAGGIITNNLPFTAIGFDPAGTVYRFGAAGGQCIAGGSSTTVYNGAALSAGGGLDISITYNV